MFDVLMYLFETYIHSDADVMVEQDELTDELSRAGFDKDEIERRSTGWSDWPTCTTASGKSMSPQTSRALCGSMRRRAGSPQY